MFLSFQMSINLRNRHTTNAQSVTSFYYTNKCSLNRKRCMFIQKMCTNKWMKCYHPWSYPGLWRHRRIPIKHKPKTHEWHDYSLQNKNTLFHALERQSMDYLYEFVYTWTSKLTEIAAGNATRGSTKNLFARARARRLLCIPGRYTKSYGQSENWWNKCTYIQRKLKLGKNFLDLVLCHTWWLA